MPYKPPASFIGMSEPTLQALVAFVFFMFVYSLFLRHILNFMIEKRIREKLRERWRETLDQGRWSSLDPGAIPPRPFTARDWAFERDDGVRLYHETAFSTRVVYAVDLSGRVPPGWGFEVKLAGRDAPLAQVGTSLRESASVWLRAGGSLGDLARALTHIAEPLQTSESHAILEDGELRIEMGVCGHVHAEFMPQTDLLRDPADMIRRAEELVAELERMAEFNPEPGAVTLAKQLEPGSPYLEESFIALLSVHPDAPETQSAIEDALAHEPRLERLAMMHAVDERIWDRWELRGGVNSYTRARLAALSRMNPGEGRTRFVSDLIARAGIEQIEGIFGAFSFKNGKPRGDDRLFPDEDAWQTAYRTFIEEATALEPRDWVVSFTRYHDRIDGAWYFDASHLTRDHLIMAVREAEFMLDKWIEQLEGDTSEEVVDAMLARLRREVGKGAHDGSVLSISILARALAAREVTAALPLLHEALGLHGNRAVKSYRIAPIERAIATLSEGIDPNVVGGMSVAEEPAAQGGLSVATAQSGDLSESASGATGVVLGLEASAEDEEVEVGEEVEAG